MPISTLHIEIDKFDKNSWHDLITRFDDASFYQTWSYGTSIGRKVSHIALKAGEDILGCCQASLRRLPFHSIGVADIHWGPLCIRKGRSFEPNTLFHLVHSIKEEYAIKRGYMLRIWPHAKGEGKEPLKQFLKSEGFYVNMSERPYRTLILDLTPSLPDLRRNLLQKWRNCLNKAEKSGIRVVEGTGNNLYDIFFKLGQEMADRKNLTAIVKSYKEFRLIQADLPEPLKMKIMICEADSEPVSAAVYSVVGDTGIYMLGATGEKGLRLNASYLLQWRMIERMKENGVRYYDLGAFNPELNPGVYHFKSGVAGKSGLDETFLGEFNGCFNLSGQIVRFLIDSKRFVGRIGEKWKRA
jgi:hypothetical protein